MEDSSDRIGPYEIEGLLGAGGMGVVYKGWHPSGLQVAVKVIKPEYVADPKYRQRFKREIEAARRVPRYCTAEIIDAQIEGGQPYLVTEFIPGPTLDQDIRDLGSKFGGDLEGLAVGTAAALTAIHDAGIIHRDLKPSNVILSSYGPRVIDFGLASLGELHDSLTSSGQVVGTAQFMPPEQQRGDELTPAADVYAWGAMVAFAATGKPVPRPPLESSPNPAEADYREQVEDLAGAVGGGILGDIVIETLALTPSRRPSAESLLQRLTRLPTSSQVLSTAARPAGRIRQREPQDAHDWEAQATEALKTRRPSYALFLAKSGISANPLHARCHYLLGLAHLQLGQEREGLDALRLAFEMDRHDLTIRREYARQLLRGPRPDPRRAWEIDPQDEAVRDAFVRHLLTIDQSKQTAHPTSRDRTADRYSNAPALPRMSEARRDAIQQAFEIAPTDVSVQNAYISVLLQHQPVWSTGPSLRASYASFSESARQYFWREIPGAIEAHRRRAPGGLELEEFIDDLISLAPPAPHAVQCKLGVLRRTAFVPPGEEYFGSGCGIGMLITLVGIVYCFFSPYPWWQVMLFTGVACIVVVSFANNPERVSSRRRKKALRENSRRKT